MTDNTMDEDAAWLLPTGFNAEVHAFEPTAAGTFHITFTGGTEKCESYSQRRGRMTMTDTQAETGNRKLILQMQYSLDGFVGGPNGEVDWVFPHLDAEYAAWCVDKLWEAGVHLMGSVTYHDMAAHWPTSNEPIAEPMNEIPKIVFSERLKEADWGETRIVSGDLLSEITRLKRERGKDLLAHGGAGFAQSLVRSGLIDEYRLIVHPVALGSGLRLFSDLGEPIRFDLVNETAFKTGAIVLELQPSSKSTAETNEIEDGG